MSEEPVKSEEFLTASDILELDDEEIVEVEVPEWGGRKIRLKTLTAGESAVFVDMASDKGKQAEANLLVFQMSAVNEKGEKLFARRDVEKLKGRSLKVMRRLAEKVLELNGLNDIVKEKAAAKND